MFSHPLWPGSIVTAVLIVACAQEAGHGANQGLGEAGVTAGPSPAGVSATAGGPSDVSAIVAVTGAGGAGAAGQAARAVNMDSAGAGAAGTPSAGTAAVATIGGAGASARAADSAPAAGQGAPMAAAGSGGAYAPCPTSDVCTILPLGDSITFGVGYGGGYRVELFRRALADAKQITFSGSLSNGPDMVDGAPFPKQNEGHSGWKIDQLLPLIPAPALQKVPHIILLMIGTNDIAQNDDLENAPERLAGLLDALVMHAPDALIVVGKLIPFGRSMAVPTYNDALAALIEERAQAKEHVMLVDQFTDFPSSELGDGVHPNQQGYERMAGVWYDAIQDLLPSRP